MSLTLIKTTKVASLVTVHVAPLESWSYSSKTPGIIQTPFSISTTQ